MNRMVMSSRASRSVMLRRGETLCQPGVPLSVLASMPTFRKVRTEDRELAAALWLIWKNEGACDEFREPFGGVATAQIDRYLLCDKDNRVTLDEYRSTAVASARLASARTAFLAASAARSGSAIHAEA